jgi:hypothetical protein
MNDYSIFYKNELPVEKPWDGMEWDLFISAYNTSERVQKVFDKANAKAKHWLIQPDYEIEESDYPSSGEKFSYSMHDESEFIRAYFKEAKLENLESLSICIDITGFIKPYMMFLIRLLFHLQVKKIDVIYSEPAQYSEKDKTKFSDEFVKEIRQVIGFSGKHSVDTSNDILIIGSGYDDKLISKIAANKNKTRKIQLFGLPSLRPDMYQENILRAHKAADAVEGGAGDEPDNYFAPANDPFITANALADILDCERSENQVTNVYLCPLATKPQALGFTIFYLTECLKLPVSIIYPYCQEHDQQTSHGISRIWKYVVEFP